MITGFHSHPDKQDPSMQEEINSPDPQSGGLVRTTEQRYTDRVSTWETILDSRQSATFPTAEMSDMVRVVRPAGEDSKPYLLNEPGVVAYCRVAYATGMLDEDTGEPKPLASSDDLQENLGKDLKSGAAACSRPLAIGDGGRLLDTVLLGMLRNKDLREEPTQLDVVSKGDAILEAVDLLSKARDRPTIVFGDPEFFADDPSKYGYTLVGPAEDEPTRAVGLVCERRTGQIEILPLGDPEVRRAIGQRTIELAGIVSLGSDGEMGLTLPGSFDSQKAEHAYPCAVINTREAVAPLSIAEDKAIHFKQLYAVEASKRPEETPAISPLPSDELVYRPPANLDEALGIAGPEAYSRPPIVSPSSRSSGLNRLRRR